MFKYAEIADIVYFWFAANTSSGAAGDGETPSYIVRKAGVAADAAKKSGGTPSLLTHADYPDGLHEIAIDTTGWDAGEYAVFCTLLISSVNPAGFCGSFRLRAAGAPIPGASVILPVMQGVVYSATAMQDRDVVIVQGDTPRVTFNLGKDYSGWTPYFGAKAKLSDAAYAIGPQAATWIDGGVKGHGYVDLTAAQTAKCGKLFSEIELRNGAQRLTAMKFTLKIIDAVIKESE